MPGLLDFVSGLFSGGKVGPEEEALRGAVAADPQSDAPRLAYADWLSAQRNPLGDYIRASCRLAAMDEYDPQRADVEAECDDLLGTYRKKWLKPLEQLGVEPAGFDRYDVSQWFDRGLVSRLVIARRGLVPGQIDALFAAAPALCGLTFDRCKPDFQAIAACPSMRRITALGLGREVRMSAQDMKFLVASPHLAQLTELSLESPPEADSLVGALIGSSWVNLRRLSLYSCDMGSYLVRQLVEWPGVAHLEQLDLRVNQINADGGQAIAESPHLGSLRQLNLDGNNIGAEGATALATAKIPALRKLMLEGNSIQCAGLAALLASPLTEGLDELRLSRNELGDEGLKMLAAWPGLQNLRKLTVESNHFSAQGIAALAASPHLEKLLELEISHNKIDAEGVAALVESPHLGTLRRLTAYGVVSEDSLGNRLREHFDEDVLSM